MLVQRLITASVVAVGLAIGATTASLAAAGHSNHGSGSGAELVLNNGAKWETDDPLRRGMNNIRSDVAAALPKIHGGVFGPADYVQLAEQLEGHIRYLTENCKLSPEADEQLHLVLAEVIEGADVMKAAADRQAGALKVVQVLNVYPEYFNHPDWQPLGH